MTADRAPSEAPAFPAPGEVVFDPFAPGYFEDPYPQYAAVRSAAPVYFDPRVQVYMLTRYADVYRLARDRSMLVELEHATPTERITTERARNAAFGAGSDKWMLFRDGDDHARLRRLASQVFTQRAVEAWRRRTEAVVDHLLTEAEQQDPFDVITEFARPLPAQIISEMLGVPDTDIPQMLEWSHALIRMLETWNTPEQESATRRATDGMIEYMEGLLVQKREHPADDLLTALLAAGDAGDHLSPDEIVAQVVMLYLAGHETTQNLIGNGLFHLFRHPAELERLRADPTLDGAAVEELLRFDAPVQFTRRIARHPFELHGTTIPTGADVLLALGAANRDPEKWGADADTLVLTRPDASDHMAFSGGAHYCLGASLARLEGRIALPRLLRRFPRLVPTAEGPEWAPRMILRGLDHFPVHLHGD